MTVDLATGRRNWINTSFKTTGQGHDLICNLVKNTAIVEEESNEKKKSDKLNNGMVPLMPRQNYQCYGRFKNLRYFVLIPSRQL